MGNIHMPAGTVTHTGEGNAAANVRSLRSSRGGNPTVSVQGENRRRCDFAGELILAYKKTQTARHRNRF